MSLFDVSKTERVIEDLFAAVRSLPSDAEIRAHWARYVCVLAAGYLETAVRQLLLHHVQTRGAPELARFISLELEKITNLKADKIVQLLNRFDTARGQRIANQIAGELKDSVDSLLNHRHRIAHGKGSQITIVTLRGYFDASKCVVRLIATDLGITL